MNIQRHRPFRAQGATLVELMLAVGIISVVMIPLIGMLSMGVDTNRKAINLTVGSRITEHLMGELQQADWATLDKWNGQDFYFDDLGLKLNGATAGELAVYVARVKISNPSMIMGIKATGGSPNTWGRQVITLVTSATQAQGKLLLDAAVAAMKNKSALSPRVYIGRALLTNLEKSTT